MPTVEIRNLKNESVGELELKDEIFGVPLNEGLIHDAIKNYLANQRQGTVKTKTRGNVAGSGKKLWKQKGTGRARIASLRSPLWKGGGNAHGPQPRDWTSEMPKKMKRGALRSVLSERLREGNRLVVDEFNMDVLDVKARNGEELPSHKTKRFLFLTTTFGWAGKTLIVANEPPESLVLSSRNIPGVKLTSGATLNIYDVLAHDRVVFTKAAISTIEERLSN
jgi:large subunit ribosomal protein L4